MDIRQVFGLNIRRLRLPKQLTQEEAGDLMQLERAHFGRLETGVQNATLMTLDRVARVLDCEWAELLDKRAAMDFAASLRTTAPRARKAQKSKKAKRNR
jgi:transcriptional regulator with XRE-family HTH domain